MKFKILIVSLMTLIEGFVFAVNTPHVTEYNFFQANVFDSLSLDIDKIESKDPKAKGAKEVDYIIKWPSEFKLTSTPLEEVYMYESEADDWEDIAACAVKISIISKNNMRTFKVELKDVLTKPNETGSTTCLKQTSRNLEEKRWIYIQTFSGVKESIPVSAEDQRISEIRNIWSLTNEQLVESNERLERIKNIVKQPQAILE